jgi:hypothetical protein
VSAGIETWARAEFNTHLAVIPGRREAANPESITTICELDAQAQ